MSLQASVISKARNDFIAINLIDSIWDIVKHPQLIDLFMMMKRLIESIVTSRPTQHFNAKRI